MTKQRWHKVINVAVALVVAMLVVFLLPVNEVMAASTTVTTMAEL